MALAAGRPVRRWTLPLDLGVGLLSILTGACIVGWAYGEGTIGGMIAAGSGAMMVFVGAAWTRKALVTRTSVR